MSLTATTFTARFTDCSHTRELPILHSSGHVNCFVCQPELREQPIKGKCPECEPFASGGYIAAPEKPYVVGEHTCCLPDFRKPIDGIHTVATTPGAATSSFKCAARAGTTGANDPQECDWPLCGCDTYADKVISALQECGWHGPQQ